MLKSQNILLVALALIVLASCSINNSDKNSSDSKSKSVLVDPKNVTFSYTIDSKEKLVLDEMIEVNCTLHNGNSSALYFYTMSCFGWEENFIVDTSKLMSYINVDCAASNPIIKGVGPDGDFEFKTHFIVKDPNLKKIDLKYFIYQIDWDTDVKNPEVRKNLKKTFIKTKNEL